MKPAFLLRLPLPTWSGSFGKEKKCRTSSIGVLWCTWRPGGHSLTKGCQWEGILGREAVKASQVLIPGRLICCVKPGFVWIHLFFTNLMTSEFVREWLRQPVISVLRGPCSPGIPRIALYLKESEEDSYSGIALLLKGWFKKGAKEISSFRAAVNFILFLLIRQASPHVPPLWAFA